MQQKLPPAPKGKNGQSRTKVFQTIESHGAFAAAFDELPEGLPFVSVELAPGPGEGNDDDRAGDKTKAREPGPVRVLGGDYDGGLRGRL